MKEMKNILIVEDEAIIALDLKNTLNSLGYTSVNTFFSGEEAIKAVEENSFDLVLMDINLKGKIDGIETADEIQKKQHIPIIFVTAFSDKEVLNRAKLIGPYGFIIKPFSKELILANIEMALYKYELENKLKENDEKLRYLFENTHDLIAFIDAQEHIIMANPAWINTFTDNFKNIFNYIYPDDLEKIKAVWKNLVINNKAIKNVEYQFKNTKDETSMTFDFSANSIENNGARNFIAIAHDITEIKKSEYEMIKINDILESKVKERTRELEEKNSDLESFAYSIAHDLRSSLRHINSFSELLFHDIKDLLNKNNLSYFDKIKKASVSMNMLIDDLLHFFRISSNQIHYTQVDFNIMIRSLIDSFKEEIIDRKIKWIIKSLPKIYGDSSMLQQVLVNLLSNAIKYSSKNNKAIIEVGYKKGNGEYIIYIKDNGVGFDERFKDKLFGVFQRLHDNNEFKGTGIGLAIVKKIINRHGGNVWAEGKVNEGATFYFSLPKDDQ